ncbi:MAG: hypothetical protein AB8H47_03630 [Bacteroidia bacterium]
MKTNKITVQISDGTIDSTVQEQMWELYSQYYNYSKESFLSRIPLNDHYSFYYKSDQLIGFTGLRVTPFRFESHWRLTIYYGQTIVHKAFRGKALMQKTGMKLMRRYWYYFLFAKVYFWCDALTYKPYLAFARTLDEYYPSPSHSKPPVIEKLMHHIGATHYGQLYQAHTGVVLKPEQYVRDPASKIKDADLSNPLIAYYHQRNPGYLEGNGLLTLAPVSSQNFAKIGMRIIRQQFRSIKRRFLIPQMIPSS